ncbi:ATPase family AAA domain-containing protein 1-A [Smittium mucronatum]|uniref:ATPase family AAA domain-containing protein 1-A n=1 Tax=Smittium mucronatum TaxID=133383 RepID=A0A1R0H5K6_9FUNG|nr:ATPase family AAA domain-containing protein 1-A [Smittium mucronatum]
MLAKALAKESGARFINLQFSTLMDKWFGESNKLVRATFTLAKKLQPSIIFIDEIDSFMRTRQSSDHEALSTMKAEFMSLWDGLTTSSNSQGDSIVVIGATNRPNDIDLAIMRRMPKRFYLKPPSQAQRVEIFKLILSSSKLEPGFDFELLANKAANLSGSDIKELCRNAAMNPVYEYMRNNPLPQQQSDYENGLGSGKDTRINSPQYDQEIDLRPLRLDDFEVALHRIDESLMSSYNSSIINNFFEAEEND